MDKRFKIRNSVVALSIAFFALTLLYQGMALATDTNVMLVADRAVLAVADQEWQQDDGKPGLSTGALVRGDVIVAQAIAPDEESLVVQGAAADEAEAMLLAGEKPPLSAGSIVADPVFVAQAAAASAPAAVEASLAPPTISVWYGLSQKFGNIGNPQKQINILGNISNNRSAALLTYQLDGGAPQVLARGPDKRRLANSGDFNVEVDRSLLTPGPHQIVVTAIETGTNAVADVETVNFDYQANVWPLPYTANWSTTTNIQDLAQVVDGLWKIEAGALRPVVLDYDRLIGIGDVGWTDYEVTVPVTIHAIDEDGFKSPSNGPGVGILLRWQGHFNEAGEQPSIGWRQFGSLSWYRWDKDANNNTIAATQMLAVGGREVDINTTKQLQFGVPYIFKASVQSVPNEPSYYRFKTWPVGEPEPYAWDVEAQGRTDEPATGSLLLVAHHVDASFGAVTVRPLSEFAFSLTTNTDGNGTVTVTPTLPSYAYGTPVKIRAFPNLGFKLSGWSGDASGDQNPLTFVLTKDAVVTANFVTAPPPTITINNPSGGSASVSPLKPTYNFGEVVTFTATSKAGFQFTGWTGDLRGNQNPKVITITQSMLVAPTFGPATPPASDDFNGCVIDTSRWTFVNPKGDATYSTNGETLSIVVPSGAEHNIWIGAKDVPRLMETATNTDFTLETKFQSQVTSEYQLQGMIVEQDADNFLRLDYYHDGRTPVLFAAAFVNGTPVISDSKRLTVPVGSDLYMRIARVGDEWTQTASYNGSNWFRGAKFTQPMVVNSVGVFAGNAAANRQTPAPAHTAVIDYFFNTSARIVPEDSGIRPLNITEVGEGTVVVNPSKPNYSCSEPIELTAVPDEGWSFANWGGALSGNTNPTTVTLNQGDLVIATFTDDSVIFTSQIFLPIVAK